MALIPLCAALILLILALAFGGKALWRTLFSILSFLVSLFALRDELLAALKTRDFRSGILLLLTAGVICCCTGKAFYAALALLIRLLGALLLPRLRAGTLEILDTRRLLNPLREQLPRPADHAILVQPHEQLLNSYFTYLMVLLAVLVAVGSALIAKATVSEALGRAAVVLSLGGTAPLFGAFPLSDCAAALCAGESGVLFRRNTLTRLMGMKLACIRTAEPVIIGSAAVYPTRPEAVGAELMLRLAATTCAETELAAAEKLAAVSKSGTAAEIERKELKELGVIAKVKDIIVLAGSAEYMMRCGLDVLPFPENAQVLHMGINGHYVGCIDFSEAAQATDGDKAPESAGFFCFANEAEAEEKRLPGEQLLHIRPASDPAVGLAEDLTAAMGVGDAFDQITVERCGRAGIAALLEQLHCAQLGRKGLLLLSIIVKALLLLLTVFGICPLWLAVLLELAVVAFSYHYPVRLLDYISKY